MGITDLIIKISSSRFARRFQYEPYIIKTVEYINPKKEDTVFVVYKEVDYLASPIEHISHPKRYISMEVNEEPELDEEKLDKVVMFFSIHDIEKEKLYKIRNQMSEKSRLFVVFYSDSGWFFKTVLRITDSNSFRNLNKQYEVLSESGFVLEEELNLNRYHIKISRYRKEG